MVELLRSKIVKVRKDHKCHGCSCRIEKGSNNILSETYVEDIIYTLYFCEDCQEWLEIRCKKCKECYELETATEGYIKECKTEIKK